MLFYLFHIYKNLWGTHMQMNMFVYFVPTHPESHWFLSAGDQLPKFMIAAQQIEGQRCFSSIDSYKYVRHSSLNFSLISGAFL